MTAFHLASAARRMLMAGFGILSLYGLAYLLSTEVFLGRVGSTRCNIRLFQSERHLRAFHPLIGLEQKIPAERRVLGPSRGRSLSPAARVAATRI